jgi:hypothetical protein
MVLSNKNENDQVPTLGFIKDATAFPMFFVAIMLMLWFKDLNGFRGTIIGILAIAFVIDGSFTLQPRLHCKPMGLNEETMYLISIYLVGMFFVFGAFIYHVCKS